MPDAPDWLLEITWFCCPMAATDTVTYNKLVIIIVPGLLL